MRFASIEIDLLEVHLRPFDDVSMGDLADQFPVVDNGDSPKWILEKNLSRSDDVEAFEYAALALGHDVVDRFMGEPGS